MFACAFIHEILLLFDLILHSHSDIQKERTYGWRYTPTGHKGGTWRTKPPDVESAVGGAFPESAANGPHLSGAPQQDRKRAIIFPERNRPVAAE